MIGQSVGELLSDRVTLDVEGIDRLYLNLYQPRLQTGGGVAAFFKQHRGAKVASTALMGPISHAFVKAIGEFARREGVEIVTFAKGERKDEVTKARLQAFTAPEGSSTSARRRRSSPASASPSASASAPVRASPG